MEFSVRKMSPAIGAEVVGVDLCNVDDETFQAIEQAWYDNLVLLFRNQKLDAAGHVAFSRRFGALQPAPITVTGDPWLPDAPEIAVMSNVEKDGKPIGSLGSGEAIWHTDMSYIETPPSASLLYSYEVPDEGGDTGFANMYMAYEQLPASLKGKVDDLQINHDASRNSADFQRKGFPIVTDPRDAPGTRHPAVRTHPVTGRNCLFLGRRRNAWAVGMDLDESEALLDELWDHAARPEFNWHHHWAVGDLLIWDNRCTLHRRDSFDPSVRRLLHRTQVVGDRPY